MGRNVNYFANLRAEYHFSKLKCNKHNFPKKNNNNNNKKSQYNLLLIFLYDHPRMMSCSQIWR